jgi:hypothetical protein
MLFRLTFAFAVLVAASVAQQPETQEEAIARTKKEQAQKDKEFYEMMRKSDLESYRSGSLKRMRERYFPANFQRPEPSPDRMTDLWTLWDWLREKYPIRPTEGLDRSKPLRGEYQTFVRERSEGGGAASCFLETILCDDDEHTEIELLKAINTPAKYHGGSLTGRPVGDLAFHYSEGSTTTANVFFMSQNVVVKLACSGWTRAGTTMVLPDPLLAQKTMDIAVMIDDYIRAYRAPARQ